MFCEYVRTQYSVLRWQQSMSYVRDFDPLAEHVTPKLYLKTLLITEDMYEGCPWLVIVPTWSGHTSLTCNRSLWLI
ncbi:hypothetical protein I7I50_02605 [Histoplasma capsulatum G186AR]|uniref:Uncharacterized protein n=1 Tax=Ajellomyces capsulatus TaxID=5037 RepID=A0A8H8D6S7_AJECA|nr:hypothetical protein I7I52_00733 [Histoplasma capsulatum]QSS71674.1 hypothetical protein I7I50_02605 [Histoplasma capsulatum G186AR]